MVRFYITPWRSKSQPPGPLRPIGSISNFKRRCSAPRSGPVPPAHSPSHRAWYGAGFPLRSAADTSRPQRVPQPERGSARERASSDLCESALQKPPAAGAPGPRWWPSVSPGDPTPRAARLRPGGSLRSPAPTTPRYLKSPQQQALSSPSCHHFSPPATPQSNTHHPPPENFPTLEALVPKEQQGDCSAGVTACLSSRLKGNSPQGTRLVASPLNCGGKGEPDSSYRILRMEVGKMDVELVTLGMKGRQEKVVRRE